MKSYVIAYVATAVAFLVGDGVWLGLIAKDFYRSQMGELMSPSPSIAAAIVFYLIFVAGLVYFAVSPAVSSNTWSTALLNGAILGLCAYATYDLTGLAVIQGFPTALALTDLAWGAVLSALAATAGFFVTRAAT